MARVTVEDCVTKVPNRFELVMLAAQRARSISAGSSLTVERDNDKNPVIALREIAEETIDLESLHNALIKSLQKHVEIDEPEEDEVDLAAIQMALGGEMEETPSQADGAGDTPESDANFTPSQEESEAPTAETGEGIKVDSVEKEEA